MVLVFQGCSFSNVKLCSAWAPLLDPSQELSEEAAGSPIPEPKQRSRLFRSQSESSDELSELDLSHGKKDAFVLEVCATAGGGGGGVGGGWLRSNSPSLAFRLHIEINIMFSLTTVLPAFPIVVCVQLQPPNRLGGQSVLAIIQRRH